jgi:hypothetical protein
MFPIFHRSYDPCELLEVLPLRRQQRNPLKERDDLPEQVLPASNDQDQGSVLLAIALDISAFKSLPNQMQHLSSVVVLTDVKLGYQLKAKRARRIALDAYGKASFTIHVSSDISIQPFLLIARTLHIFTIPNIRSWTCGRVVRDARGFQHLARFIDSNGIYCLTTF